jgi:hypothetical protein
VSESRDGHEDCRDQDDQAGTAAREKKDSPALHAFTKYTRSRGCQAIAPPSAPPLHISLHAADGPGSEAFCRITTENGRCALVSFQRTAALPNYSAPPGRRNNPMQIAEGNPLPHAGLNFQKQLAPTRMRANLA